MSTISIIMLLNDRDSYYQLKLADLVNLKCDSCSEFYQKTKKSWYYSAYRRGSGLNFNIKTTKYVNSAQKVILLHKAVLFIAAVNVKNPATKNTNINV